MAKPTQNYRPLIMLVGWVLVMECSTSHGP
jgi:hypothetical protein